MVKAKDIAAIGILAAAAAGIIYLVTKVTAKEGEINVKKYISVDDCYVDKNHVKRGDKITITAVFTNHSNKKFEGTWNFATIKSGGGVHAPIIIGPGQTKGDAQTYTIPNDAETGKWYAIEIYVGYPPPSKNYTVKVFPERIYVEG